MKLQISMKFRSSRVLAATVALAFLVTQTSDADVIDFLFGAGSFGRKASPIADSRCIISRLVDNTRFWRDQTWKDRVVLERNPKFLSDKEFLEEMRYSTALLGQVDTRYIKEFDTRFYFTATAKALPNGSIPMVDPEAKALYIYIHGSGTSKASGVNFAGKANSLAKFGYSVVGIDLPFHADGSRNPVLAKTGPFAAYIDSIVKTLRQPGQPVYLVGHSFGPDVIAEYMTRYPYGVDGAVMLSPGGFDKITQKWFEEKTVNMTKTFGEVEPNNMGGKWAGMVTSENLWNRLKAPGRQDPTEVNENLKVLVVSGDREEYIPGELDEFGVPTSKPRDYDVAKVFKGFFHGAEVQIEPGVGHYIFAHEDADKQDVVLRSLLKIDGHSLKDEQKALKAAALKVADQHTPIDNLALRYSKEPFFKQWLDRFVSTRGEVKNGQELIAQLLREDDKKTATKLVSQYNTIEKQRYQIIDDNIKSTQQWAPDFYLENKDTIARMEEKGFDKSGIRFKYLAHLKTLEESVIAQHSQATEAVYEIPEKSARKPGSLASTGYAARWMSSLMETMSEYWEKALLYFPNFSK